MNSIKQERSKLCVRIKEMREYCGYSQEDVAAHLGIPRTAVSLMESGARRVTATELRRLAKFFRTSMEYIMGADSDDSQPEAMSFVARAAADLSPADQEEVMRFVEFLKVRSASEQTK